MKKHVPFTLLCLLASTIAVAAQTGSGDRFQQLDKDGDGKITREESGNARWFDAVDKNQDGVVTREDFRISAPVKKGPDQPAPQSPKPAPIPLGDVPRNDTAATPLARLVFTLGFIYDAAHPVPTGQKLTGCRDIEPSPFPGEAGRVFYFCGYDGGAGPGHDTAWIYRGILQSELPGKNP